MAWSGFYFNRVTLVGGLRIDCRCQGQMQGHQLRGYCNKWATNYSSLDLGCRGGSGRKFFHFEHWTSIICWWIRCGVEGRSFVLFCFVLLWAPGITMLLFAGMGKVPVNSFEGRGDLEFGFGYFWDAYHVWLAIWYMSLEFREETQARIYICSLAREWHYLESERRYRTGDLIWVLKDKNPGDWEHVWPLSRSKPSRR